MSAKPAPVIRPMAITITCSILYAAGLFSILYTFTGAFATYGLFYSAINTLLVVLIFAALSGVWGMEKWGIWFFALVVIIKFGNDWYSGAFLWWELLLLIPLIIFISQFRKMK
jgi:hypothetical protein